jgi:hypothetical protein
MPTSEELKALRLLEPWQMTWDEYRSTILGEASDPENCVRFIKHTFPITKPLGKPSAIESTAPDKNGYGSVRWNDHRGRGQAIAVFHNYIFKIISIAPEYEGQGIRHKLGDIVADFGIETGTHKGVSEDGFKWSHAWYVRQAYRKGKPVPQRVLDDRRDALKDLLPSDTE